MKIAYFITLLNLFTQVQSYTAKFNKTSLDDPFEPLRISCTSESQKNIRLKEFKNNNIVWRTESEKATADCYQGNCGISFEQDSGNWWLQILTF